MPLVVTPTQQTHRGKRKGAHLHPPGFGHLVKYLVKILSFCVKILKFGQNTNICSPLQKFLRTPMNKLNCTRPPTLLWTGMHAFNYSLKNN